VVGGADPYDDINCRHSVVTKPGGGTMEPTEDTKIDQKDVVDSNDPRVVIWDIIRSQWRFSALYAFVDLDLAGWFGCESLSVRQLAERCGADSPALARLLRTAAGLGLVRSVASENGERVYALTPAGNSLRDDVRGSMRSIAVLQGAPDFLMAMGSLADTVRNGHSGFAQRFDSFYGYLESHPETRRHFDIFMSSRSLSIAEAVAAQYDFSGITTIADIGGGIGRILATILQANSRMRGILLDLEPVIAKAPEFLSAQNVADRCELVAGSFFRPVPKAEAHLLSNIIHNWDDEHALCILHNVLEAMPKNGRVLLLDMLLPEDDRPHLGKEMDMRLLALYDGGRERGRQEYLSLLVKAGLRVNQVIELPYVVSLIEAFPA